MAEETSKSLADSNREFFNKHAESFANEEWIKTTMLQLTRLVQSNVDSFGIRKPSAGGSPVRLLDYACGYGVVSWALRSFVDEIRGIDVSEAMVTKFNESAASLGLAPEKAFAIRGDLLSTESQELENPNFYDFDVVIISMALHHVSDPQAMVTKLVERLKPGGVLMVVEGTSHEEVRRMHAKNHAKHHGHVHQTINHHEFTRESISAWLSKGGCSEDSLSYVIHDEISNVPESVTKTPGGLNRRLFIVSAAKAGLVK